MRSFRVFLPQPRLVRTFLALFCFIGLFVGFASQTQLVKATTAPLRAFFTVNALPVSFPAWFSRLQPTTKMIAPSPMTAVTAPLITCTIAKQDFEVAAATPTWSITAGAGNTSATTGGGAETPAGQRIRGGTQSWQVNGGTATLSLAALNVTGYTGLKAKVHISSTSTNSSNGADLEDSVKVSVALNGGAFPASPDITVTGFNNARWSYNNTVNATTTAGTPVTFQGTAGTNQGTIYSSLEINIPNGTTQVALQLIALNNQGNEVWNVDDIELCATGIAQVGAFTTSTATVCQGQTGVVYTVPNTAGFTYNWSYSGTGATINGTTNSVTVDYSNSATSGTLSVTASDSCGNVSTARTLAITVNQPPTTANAGAAQTICATLGSAPMAANALTIGTGAWTQVGGPVTGTITSPTSPTTTITGLTTAGLYTFQWTMSNAPCASSSDQVVVTVAAPPTAANAGPDQTVCGLVATLAGNAPTIGAGMWTLVSGPGTIAFSAATSATSTATASVAGAYTLRWTTTNAPCAATQADVTITYVAAPTTANAGADQTICATPGSATMAGNTALVGTGTWTQVSGPATGTITTASSPTTTITGLTTAGTYVFEWGIRNSPCPASTDQVTITVAAVPTTANAGADQTICETGTALLAGNAPSVGIGAWTILAGSPSIVLTQLSDPAAPAAIFTPSEPGIYTLQWTISNAPCTASMDTVVITVKDAPTIAAAGADQSLCNVTSATMAGNAPVFGTGLWTQASGPNTATITTTGSPTTTMTGLVIGTYTFRWTISNTPCTASFDEISVTIAALPTTAAAGSDQTLCTTTPATLAANAPMVGTGAWSVVMGPSLLTSQLNDVTSPTATFTPMGGTAGTYILRWTISNAPCTASSDDVVLTYNSPPTAANAGADQSLCNVTSTTMAGNTLLVGTGTWTQVSGPNTATITTASSPTTTMTGLVAGTYNFQWETRNSPCMATTDTVSVIIAGLPTTANAGADQMLCNVTSATMAGNAPSVGTGAWTQVNGPTTATITTPGSPTTTMTGLMAGTYIFSWTISNAPCAASTDQVQVIVTPLPTVANAGGDQSLCAVTQTTMVGNTPTVGTGAWTQVSGPTTAAITVANSPTTTMTDLTSGTYVFQWTISNTPCAASTDQVQVTIVPNPTTANAGNDQTICATATTMEGNSATVGTGAWTQISGPNTAIITTASSPTTTMTSLVAGTYVFQWAISNAPCAVSSDQVQVIVVPNPTTATAGADQTLCTTAPALLAANLPVIGTGTWSIVSGPSALLTQFSSPTVPTATFTPVSAGAYTLRWTISNAPCLASSDDVVLTYSAPPTTAAAGADQTLCTTAPALLAANAPALGTGAWSIVSGPSALLTQFSSTTLPTATFTPIAAGAYTLRWTTSNAPCAISADDVALTYVAPPTPANAGADQTTCSTATLAANVPASGLGSWTVVAGPSTALTQFSNSTLASAVFTPAGGVGTYTLRWTTSNAPCATFTDDVVITVNAAPTVITNPVAQTICEGSAATFTAAGTGMPVPTVKWQVNTGSGFTDISGASSTTLILTGVALAQNGAQYRAVFTNSCSSVNSTAATLTIKPNPVVNAVTPADICSGATTNIALASTPSGATFNWTIGTITGTVTGQIAGSGSTIAQTLTGSGTVTYIVTPTLNGCPGTPVNLVQVVNQPVAATALTDVTVCEGTVATLSTTASGTGPFTFVWKKGSTVLATSGARTISGTATTSTLTINPTALADAGAYAVEVTGTCGTVSKTANVTICQNTTATALTNQTITQGSSVSFTTTAAGTGPFSYVWKKGSTVLATGGSLAISSTASTGTLTINNSQVTDQGTYTVEVTGKCNTVSQSVTLTVLSSGSISGKLTDPLDCTGPGNILNVTAQITNTSPLTQTFNFTASPDVPGQLIVIGGSCNTTGQISGTCSTTASTVTFSGPIAAGQVVTITYQVQVGESVTPGTQLCVTSQATPVGGTTSSVRACANVTCPADPGIPNTGASDQNAGSVLFFPLISSDAAAPNRQNTRLSLTNTNQRFATAIHLFFVDGATCSVADSYLCLTANQTATFTAADLDPGTTGYLVAVAVDSKTGCPRSFNSLIGDEYVKLASGHAANLGAEALRAIAGGAPACDVNSNVATLRFDGVSYSRAPRVLALDNIGSRLDGNDTLLVVNQFGGSLMTGAATLGSLFGLFYNDAESPLSFSVSSNTCQLRGSINNNFPRLTPRFEQFVPAGRSGWLKLWATNDTGLFGAALNYNASATTNNAAFAQGHNLHKLTTTSAASLTVPVFPPNC